MGVLDKVSLTSIIFAVVIAIVALSAIWAGPDRREAAITVLKILLRVKEPGETGGSPSDEAGTPSSGHRAPIQRTHEPEQRAAVERSPRSKPRRRR